MKSITDVKIENKTILLREDLNVTLDVNGNIIDDIKIKSALKTIKYLIDNKAKKIIIVSHLGRPIIRGVKGIKNIIEGNRGLRLLPIAQDLAKKLNLDNPEKAQFEEGFDLPFYKLNEQIWLMENVRFDAGEENNDEGFARQMAKLADVYIDDAFGNIHRNHASMVAITKYLPAYAGILLEKEVVNLSKLFRELPKPFILIMGGAKVSEKILILEKLINKADKVLLGGVMANTFLASRNIDMKSSKVDKESLPLAKKLYSKAAKKFYLPTDVEWRNQMVVDIGKTTISQFEKIIYEAGSIFWNGTMGLTSLGNFKYSYGTRMIIKAIADSKAKEKIICGGDTIAEVDKLKMGDKMTHLSTGGGAALAFLAGKDLPALDVLEGKNDN